MRTVLMLTSLLVVLGCATNGAAPGAEPDVTFIQLSRVAEGTQFDTGPISVQYAVEVKNTMTAAVQLRRVAVQSIGGGAYTVGPYSQGFNETIGPGETRRVSFWAPARVTMPTVGGANGPVTLRGTLDLQSAGRTFQKVVVQNIASIGGE